MLSPYYTDIKNSEKIRRKSDLAQEIFTQLSSIEYSHNMKVAYFQEMFSALSAALKNIPYCPKAYFDKYLQRFFYEVILDTYNSIAISLNMKNPCTPKMIDCILQYLNDSELNYNEKSLTQKISKRKSKFLEELEDKKQLIFDRNKNRKLNNYYNYISAPLPTEHSPNIAILEKSDYIFNLLYFPETIYAPKHYTEGILIYYFYYMVKDYLHLHKDNSPISFQAEYSAFLFEKLHFPIQFMNCFSSFLKRPFISYEFPKEYWQLFQYIRIFDTKYISLTDYILNTFKDSLDHFYESSIESQQAFIFCEMQMLDSFWLPLLSLVIKETLYNALNGNLELAKQLTHDYIKDYICGSHINNYSYQTLLQNATLQIEDCFYPNTHLRITEKSAKTGTPEHHFNMAFSKCFYTKELSNYVSNCLYQDTAFCDFNYCLKTRLDIYNLYKETLSQSTIKDQTKH